MVTEHDYDHRQIFQGLDARRPASTPASERVASTAPATRRWSLARGARRAGADGLRGDRRHHRALALRWSGRGGPTASTCAARLAEARAKGETEQRIYLLSAWREAPVYTARERAALAWTDALTQLSQGHTHEAAHAALSAEFSEEEQVRLTLVINVINGWNRLAVGFGTWLEQPARNAAA